MSKLDEAISNVAYILDTLMAYRNVEKTGCCNNCKKRIKCGYTPKAWQILLDMLAVDPDDRVTVEKVEVFE